MCKKRGWWCWGCGVSQGHSGAGVFELAGQHSSVKLIKLHQVDEVGELGGAVVEAEEHLTVFLTLTTGERREERTADHQVTETCYNFATERTLSSSERSEECVSAACLTLAAVLYFSQIFSKPHPLHG